MYITKILETTIPAGGSSATFTDSDIPNSLIRVFATDSNIFPLNVSLTGNTLTVTYENLSSSLGVAVELVKDDLEIVDALNSDASDKALSAYQGKVLYDALNDLSIPEDISDLDDVAISDISDGQVLAWDAELHKFINANQSGGSSHIYSTTPVKVGKYIDDNDVYEVVIEAKNITVPANSSYAISLTPYIGSNYDRLVFFFGQIESLKRSLPFNIVPASTYAMSCEANLSSGNISVYRASGGAYTGDFTFILRYTVTGS